MYNKEYYANGNLKSEGWMMSGEKTSYWYHYHENGKIAARGHYEKNSKTEYWYYYNKNGSLEREGHYKKGDTFCRLQPITTFLRHFFFFTSIPVLEDCACDARSYRWYTIYQEESGNQCD